MLPFIKPEPQEARLGNAIILGSSQTWHEEAQAAEPKPEVKPDPVSIWTRTMYLGCSH